MRRGGGPRIFFLAAAALRRSKKSSKNGCGLIGGVGLNQAFCLDITRPFERKRVLSKRVRGLYPPVAEPSGLLREIGQKCLKRRRMRCRRLHVYSTDPRRPQGDLFDRD